MPIPMKTVCLTQWVLGAILICVGADTSKLVPAGSGCGTGLPTRATKLTMNNRRSLNNIRRFQAVTYSATEIFCLKVLITNSLRSCNDTLQSDRRHISCYEESEVAI